MGVTHVIAMIRIISLIFLFLFTVSCGTDYSVITNEEIEIVEPEPEVETEIIIDYFIQPEKPENLDVLVVLDTSCSMSDNYENVSLGLDLLRGDIEILTYDYQMALINLTFVKRCLTKQPLQKLSITLRLESLMQA